MTRLLVAIIGGCAIAFVILTIPKTERQGAASSPEIDLGVDSKSKAAALAEVTAATDERTATDPPKRTESELEGPSGSPLVHVPPASRSAAYSLHPGNEQVLARFREELLSEDPFTSRKGTNAFVMRAIATVMEFEGSPGDWSGSNPSMAAEAPEQRVIFVNGGIYRFDTAEFPVLDALLEFNTANPVRSNGQTSPLAEGLLSSILELGDYAIVIASSGK